MSQVPQPPSDPQSPAATLPVLAGLQRVLRLDRDIAAAVEQMANESSGRRKRSLQKLAHWFADAPQPDDVLLQADALAICLPLIEPASRGQVQGWQVEDAVRQSGAGVAGYGRQRYRFLQGLIYPFTVLVLCGLIVSCFLWFLVPEFDSMFSDFDMELPAPTQLVLWLSRWLRQWGVVVLGGSLIAGVILFFSLRPFWARSMATKCELIAAWTRHLSLLLAAGVPDEEALQLAGRASQYVWLNELSQICVAQLQRGREFFKGPLYAGSQPVAMIGYALLQDSPQTRSDWLEEVTEMYRERDQFRWNAWLAWTTPLAVCLAAVTVGLLIVALFLPLVGLISALG